MPIEIEALENAMVVTNFKKDDYLQREGQVSSETFFVVEGCVRQFCIVDGEDKTTNFFTEGDWIISPSGITAPKASSHSLICMEDSSLVIGNEEKAQLLFKEHPRFETLARMTVEQSFAKQQQLMTTYLIDTPEQRYLNLLKTRPNLIQRIPQYHLASFIGVKPESLSRIRKRIMDKD